MEKGLSNKIKPPTHRALMATLQFLSEHYPNSFEMLIEESGEEYDTTVLPHANSLLSAMDAYQEILDAEATADERAEKRRITESLDALSTSTETPISVLHSTHDYVHDQNIIAVDLSFDADRFIFATGSTDKIVKVTDYKEKKVIYSSSPLPSPILSVAWNPVQFELLAASCMNGYHCLIDYKEEKIVKEFKDHQKYIVRVKWSSDGACLATASHDNSLRLYKEREGEWRSVYEYEYKGQVEAVEFVPGSSLLVVSVRDDCCLHAIDISTGQEIGTFNMNATGDDHVSFAALDLCCNSDGRWILASTDKHRTIMFETGTSLQVRNFYGTTNDHFSNPRSVWSSTDKYVYSTSQDQTIVGWDVCNDKLLCPLVGHTRTVRDLCSRSGVLASASFDRTVKIWSAP